MRLKPDTLKGLSQNEASLELAALGILAGLLAGLVVNLFRLVLEFPFPLLGLGVDSDDFESLPAWACFALPVAGSALLALIFHLGRRHQPVGVSHVIDKVQNFRGDMPPGNAVMQFISASIALLTGHSCGREGPAIHMGAASSSLMGRWFHLPNNANRTMIACGSAAAIAASFNTPIAGVIFTMEVIMMEYSIAGFIPVIIAAVSGAVITQLFYGDAPVFQIGGVSMNSLWELPYIAAMGIIIGMLAALFIRVQKYVMSYSSLDQRKRLLLAGLLTGCVAIFVPQVMGIGYDTLNDALGNNFGLGFLLPLLAAKLLLTAVILGLGVPGGVIGPSLMIGGLAGSVLGILGTLAMPDYPASPAFYTLLGMCAMMGAVLQAPLAALMAMLELSGNPNLILPAMLIIVVANLTSGEVFSTQSIFQLTLQQQGIKTPKTLTRLLNRYGVSAILDPALVTLKEGKPPEKLAQLLAGGARWVVLSRDGERRLLTAGGLEKKLPNLPGAPAAAFGELFEAAEPLAAISLRATLQEAMEALQRESLEHGYVYSPLLPETSVLGIISVDAIIAFYKDR